jgi:hypothetical protein
MPRNLVIELVAEIHPACDLARCFVWLLFRLPRFCTSSVVIPVWTRLSVT